MYKEREGVSLDTSNATALDPLIRRGFPQGPYQRLQKMPLPRCAHVHYLVHDACYHNPCLAMHEISKSERRP